MLSTKIAKGNAPAIKRAHVRTLLAKHKEDLATGKQRKIIFSDDDEGNSTIHLSEKSNKTPEPVIVVNGNRYNRVGFTHLVEGFVNCAAEQQKLESAAKRLKSVDVTESSVAFEIKEKRRVYSLAEKGTIVQTYDEYEGSKKAALSFIQSFRGYEKVTHKTIGDFRKCLKPGRVYKHMGRPVCEEFESEVLSECVIYKLVIDSKNMEQFQVF
jgi:hypothetical protein